MVSKCGRMDTYIKELYTGERRAWPYEECKQLHFINGNYYVVSRVEANDHGDYETMIFPSDKDGEVISYSEVYACRGLEAMVSSVNQFKEELEKCQ